MYALPMLCLLLLKWEKIHQCTLPTYKHPEFLGSKGKIRQVIYFLRFVQVERPELTLDVPFVILWFIFL